MAPNPCALCCCCTLLVVGIALMALSFATIGPLNAGLKYDTIQVKYDWNTVYKSGRYAVGPGAPSGQLPGAVFAHA